MNNKAVWVVIGLLTGLIPVGVLIIPVGPDTGIIAILSGRAGGLISFLWLPTAIACFAFYKAFKSND